MPTPNPLSSDAEQFTAIDLSQYRRPTDHGDQADDGETMPPTEFIDRPTQAEVDEANRQTIARVAAMASYPDAAVAEPGTRQLVYVYGLNHTMYGALTGYDLARVPVCRHGSLVPIVLQWPGGEQRYEYADMLGFYVPVSA